MDMNDEIENAGTALHGATGHHGIGLYQEGTGRVLDQIPQPIQVIWHINIILQGETLPDIFVSS
jgi:hypothetical protein